MIDATLNQQLEPLYGAINLALELNWTKIEEFYEALEQASAIEDLPKEYQEIIAKCQQKAEQQEADLDGELMAINQLSPVALSTVEAIQKALKL